MIKSQNFNSFTWKFNLYKDLNFVISFFKIFIVPKVCLLCGEIDVYSFSITESKTFKSSLFCKKGDDLHFTNFTGAKM